MKIGTKLKLLMLFLMISILTTSGLSFWNAKKLSEQINTLGEIQLPGSSNMILTDMMHDGIRANVYSAIIAAKDKDVEEIAAIKLESKEFATNIRNYVSNLQKINLKTEIKNAIEPALPKIENYVKAAEKIVGVALSGDEKMAREMRPEFNQSFEELEKDLGILGELIEADSVKTIESGKAIERNATIINLISLMIGITILIFFRLVMNEQQKQLVVVVKNLNSETAQLNTTANSFSKSAENLTKSTSVQSIAIQESTSALSQISSTAMHTQDNTKKLKENSALSFNSAQQGQEKIEQMLKAMTTILESNTKVMNQVEEGNNRISSIITIINEIESKTKVINDIVFQTKLLSFNASVEAARAGESGKGFAVVAEEVGNLASMSGSAAKEISDMLSKSIQTVEEILKDNKSKIESSLISGKHNVDSGITIANQCGDSLKDIVFQASSISTLIKELSTSIEEQTTGVTEVSSSMNKLDQVSQQNIKISSNNLDSSKELQNQVLKLESEISTLNSMLTSS